MGGHQQIEKVRSEKSGYLFPGVLPDRLKLAVAVFLHKGLSSHQLTLSTAICQTELSEPPHALDISGRSIVVVAAHCYRPGMSHYPLMVFLLPRHIIVPEPYSNPSSTTLLGLLPAFCKIPE